uniref:Uncharacterized protein n=1 Tax=Acrobeloides nanus TaxID=290746 RepID=A0A914CFZ9_9BILA
MKNIEETLNKNKNNALNSILFWAAGEKLWNKNILQERKMIMIHQRNYPLEFLLDLNLQRVEL